MHSRIIVLALVLGSFMPAVADICDCSGPAVRTNSPGFHCCPAIKCIIPISSLRFRACAMFRCARARAYARVPVCVCIYGCSCAAAQCVQPNCLPWLHYQNVNLQPHKPTDFLSFFCSVRAACRSVSTRLNSRRRFALTCRLSPSRRM